MAPTLTRTFSAPNPRPVMVTTSPFRAAGGETPSMRTPCAYEFCAATRSTAIAASFARMLWPKETRRILYHRGRASKTQDARIAHTDYGEKVSDIEVESHPLWAWLRTWRLKGCSERTRPLLKTDRGSLRRRFP